MEAMRKNWVTALCTCFRVALASHAGAEMRLPSAALTELIQSRTVQCGCILIGYRPSDRALAIVQTEHVKFRAGLANSCSSPARRIACLEGR